MGRRRRLKKFVGVQKSSEKSGVVDEEEVSAGTELPIDIYSRLSLPLVPRSLAGESKDDEDESDEEDSIEIRYRPRFVFLSNLCLVCMEVSKVVCEFCHMVSYCSTAHRTQGWTSHQDLCRVLTEVCAKEDGLSLARGLSADCYKVYRLKLVEIIENGVARPLELWEREILLFPRVCRVCHEFSRDLLLCPECKVEFYCQGHRQPHEKWCSDFRVLRRILLLQHRHGYVTPEIPNFEGEVDLESFDRAILQVYGDSPYYREMDCHSYSSLSHAATIPLTTLYALRKSVDHYRTMKRILVHVVGAEFQFECANLRVWEKLFLHLLPELNFVNLTFIGSELHLPAEAPVDLLGKVRTCANCKARDRRVNVEFKPGTFYHEYANSREFAKPDMVCLFNPGLYRETAFNGRDSWPETIREFCKLKVVVLVTSYTRHEIPREIQRIRSICDVDVVCEPRKNPFSSLKPDKNFVSDDTDPVIYKNYFLAVIKGK